MDNSKEVAIYRQPEVIPHSQPSPPLTPGYSGMELFLLTENELTARQILSMIELRPTDALKDRS